MDIGLPVIKVEFQAKAETFIQRSQNGIVDLILETDIPELINSNIICKNSKDIPVDLDEKNKKHILNALIGNFSKPYRIEVFFIDKFKTEDRFKQAIEFFTVTKANYLTTPIVLTQDEKLEFYDFITLIREEESKPIKFIAANFDADHEAFINFTSLGMEDKFKLSYTTEDFLPRISGFIAGTPINISTTYSSFPEIVKIDKKTRTITDQLINNGEYVLYDNGDPTNNIVAARGVNSLRTLRNYQNDQFRKIKIIEIIDMMTEDIQTTARRHWVGKLANNYDNKILLIAEIMDYFQSLQRQEIIDAGWEVGIDMDAQMTYLESIGENVSEMTELEIKKANTRDKVFLKASIKVLDAIEDIYFKVAV